MSYDRKVYRASQDAIGAPGDDRATDSTGDWTLVSLLKGIYNLLSGTLTVTTPVGSATAAKQDLEIAGLTAIDGHVDGIETLLGTTNTEIGGLTETAPASDTASSGLNGRLQRIAQRVTALIALLPAALGQTTKTASLSVSVASDDDLQAKLGIVTETAPASDTASSGLNGRLQRIAQRITSLIALVPTSLGAKTAANSFAITTATDDATIALYGAVAETAPASDTASSGINGRLQRIAQRITSLIALVPASLGAKTAAGSFLVTTATDDNTLALLGAVNETAPASDTASSGLNGRLQRAAQRLTSLIALVPAALTGSGNFKVAIQEALPAGTALIGSVSIKDISNGEYETVAASQTAQVLGATGAAGDFISGLLIIPATTSPGNVLLLDNATSITVFAGGALSVSNLVPFFVPLGMISVSGAWKVTTGTNVSVIGIGNFT